MKTFNRTNGDDFIEVGQVWKSGKATFKVEKIEHGPLVDNLYQIDEELYNKRVSEGKTIGEGFIITGLFGIPSGFAGTSRMSELEFRNKFNR